MAVAVSAIGAAAAAVGTEAFVGLALTAVADTGLALTVVGAVTGSKDLMKAGAVLGVAGGVGGMINGAFGAAGAAAEGAASSAGDVTAGTLADEGAAAVQGNSVNALDQGLNYDGIAKLDAAPDLSSAASTTSAPLDSTAVQTGQSIGGNPTLAGAGGNADPSTGMSGGSPSPPTASPAAPGVGTDVGDNAVQGNSVNALDRGANYNGGIVNGTRASSIIDGIKDLWGGLSKDSQATILRAALSVPGGIQQQKNKARELALQEARVKQTSYGSAVPSFSQPGIINSAKG